MRPGKYKDYTGREYGRLTFLNFAERKDETTFWKLHCDCGNEITAPAYKVIDGDILSCGCIRWKDYTGQKYGMLTFLRRVTGVGNRTMWQLTCDCGREITAMSENVIGGGTRSCGCVRRHGAATFINGILCNYMRHASDRGFAFKLTREQVIELIHQPCFYCGAENSNTWVNKRTGEQYGYNGIDRFDSMGDYEDGNVVPCCASCNWAKSNQDGKAFIAWARRLVAYQDSKDGK
jgi:hypothetical protein